jgi:hypothetical protein
MQPLSEQQEARIKHAVEAWGRERYGDGVHAVAVEQMSPSRDTGESCWLVTLDLPDSADVVTVEVSANPNLPSGALYVGKHVYQEQEPSGAGTASAQGMARTVTADDTVERRGQKTDHFSSDLPSEGAAGSHP